MATVASLSVSGVQQIQNFRLYNTEPSSTNGILLEDFQWRINLVATSLTDEIIPICSSSLETSAA
jgi:hypothetical protein